MYGADTVGSMTEESFFSHEENTARLPRTKKERGIDFGKCGNPHEPLYALESLLKEYSLCKFDNPCSGIRSSLFEVSLSCKCAETV